jgi:hypothetical protein
MTGALQIFLEDSEKPGALVERQILVTQLTTTREAIRAVLAEVGSAID